MIRNYLEHAEALTWALEAGTRIGMGKGMRGGAGYFQSLVEETAKQNGIVYLAVTEGSGMILAHNDPARIGSSLHDPEPMAALAVQAEQRGHFRIMPDGGKVFEVYKNFSPLPGVRRSMWCGPGGGHRGDGLGQESGLDDAVIFVGLDAASLDEAMANELRTSAIIAALVVLMGMGGFAALFWAQHYRLSSRLLRDTQAFASEVVTCLPLGLLTTDPEGRVVLANAMAARLLGREGEDLSGSDLRSLGGLDWSGFAADLAAADTVLEREATLGRRDGGTVPVSLNVSRIVNTDGQFLGHLFLLRDLGELRRLQEQVRRNDRLTALGSLAAGVAHEIRNPLSSIKGFATYLSGKVQGPD
ncbi:MAG TPA: PAS domain-containing protein, partial [Chromatiaceae bacterium]|nr:PAS domain-containing protein [Chromatiaceae bacterium]